MNKGDRVTSPTLLFGASSILGFQLAKGFPQTIRPFVPPGNKASALCHWPVLHLEDPQWIKRQFDAPAPRLLLYGHAVCDVPKCEADPEWAQEMNVKHLKRVLAALPAKTRMVYISSDHVFGGDGFYSESATPCPISVYGQTRVEAESWVLKRSNTLVIRTGLALGPSPNGRTGHLDWLAYRNKRGLPITIIKDESRSVVWAKDLAERVMQWAQSDVCGLRHIPATQVLSRMRLAKALMQAMGKVPNFKIEGRNQQSAPHLGRVGLKSDYRSSLSQALPSAIDALEKGRLPSL